VALRDAEAEGPITMQGSCWLPERTGHRLRRCFPTTRLPSRTGSSPPTG
jgi:hypothetical protein